MPPIALNRRRFLGCSAAASLALSQGTLAETDLAAAEARPVRLGVIGIGNRGSALLRALLDLPAAQVVGVCDAHRGEWIGVDTVFPLRRNFADQTHRRVIARLIQAGVLAAAGLEMQPERPGYHRLFRAAAAKASVASGQLSVAKGHEPPTTDPAP